MLNPHWLTDKEATSLDIKQEDGPIFKDRNGLYYFCDEVWVNLFGPFNTRKEASIACREYALSL